MYLDYFKIKEYPFCQTPNINFYYDLPSHQEALNVLLVSLRMQEGIIKITGDTGAGKTLLCHLLLEKLDGTYYPIYLPNPHLTYDDLLECIATELDIKNIYQAKKHQLYKTIQKKLIGLNKEGKHVILIFDEAQALSDETLESIRILSNLETKEKKLIQIVLVGGLELDKKFDGDTLRHFKQRISFTHRLAPIGKENVRRYIMHRLSIASFKNTGSISITPSANHLLYKITKGSPRLINILCHKALMFAYGRGDKNITYSAIKSAAHDTDSVDFISKPWFLVSGAVVSIIVFLLIYTIYR